MSDAVEFSPAKSNEMERKVLVTNKRSFNWVTERVSSVCEKQTLTWWWWVATGICALVATLVPAMLTYLVSTGVGVWGLNHPVGWAWDITNFVFWIGIGHAGTLISAILFLTRQKWRTAVNRSAEAMTIFAVICAGIFPAFHVGRIWLVWFLAPVPNANAIWPNFKSPLLWDVFAVSTYFTVSLIFWYTGLIPDFATFRDRAVRMGNKIKAYIYGFFALGWKGGNRQWRNYEKAYLVFAGISTPLVLSVHSIVSFDFATSVIPGWHTTIFPPYFVAGAIFGGFAMVLTLLIPFRVIFKLEDIITIKHIDNMSKIIVLTGCIVGYAYLSELFIAWYGGNPYEWWAFLNNRVAFPGMADFVNFFGNIINFFLGIFGMQPVGKMEYIEPAPYWWSYWLMMGCNVISPQLFWIKKFRTTPWICWLIVFFGPNVGMWYERFVIIVTSIHRDFLPGSWGHFAETWVDWTLFIGTIGLFCFLFLMFVRFMPMITMFEVKAVMPQADSHFAKDEEIREIEGAKKEEANA